MDELFYVGGVSSKTMRNRAKEMRNGGEKKCEKSEAALSMVLNQCAGCGGGVGVKSLPPMVLCTVVSLHCCAAW
jgi:hypothetical protein